MSSIPATGNTQYFVGVNGQQNGPFSESQLIDQIRSGKIPQDALVWFEGMTEWQSIKTVPALRDAYSLPAGGAPSPSPMATSAQLKPLETHTLRTAVKVPAPAEGDRDSSFFAAGGMKSGPVFDSSESLFSTTAVRNKKMKRLLLIGGGLTLFAVLILVFRFTVIGGLDFVDGVKITTPTTSAPAFSSRETRLRAASSELLLKPVESLAELKKLVEEKADDKIGPQALEVAVEYYKTHSPKEAGTLMMAAGRPLDAVPFFMTDPPDYRQAEQAYEKAVADAKDPTQKKKVLALQVSLLLGPMNDVAKATVVLRSLEKLDPSAVAPYAYYLKDPEGKMADLFSRISFYYVQTLLAYMDTEMPQIKFEKRPLAEIRRDKQGKYRLVGTYTGEVLLNRDRMSDIGFEFWLVRDRWALVGTNLTDQRQKFAAQERTKLANEVLSREEMLRNLETTFRSQFPKTALHERPSEKKPERPE